MIFISYNGEVKCCLCMAQIIRDSEGVLILFSENLQTDIKNMLGDSKVTKSNNLY